MFRAVSSSAVMHRRLTATAASTAAAALVAQRRAHATEPTGDRSKPFKIKWKKPTGEVSEGTAYDGQTLLEAALEHGIAIEAACAGSCACSTCHVYLEQEMFDKMPEPSDTEYDMLDQAFFQEPTSRLACQVKLEAAEHDGMTASLPKATRNMAVDGYVAMPH